MSEFMMKFDAFPFIMRNYHRHCKPLQWLREITKNAIDAGAKLIEIGLCPVSVKFGTHRYWIADDGCGMASDEFEKFLMTYGGGGKPIGDGFANFGIGFKVSALPWNQYGVVVISIKDGYAGMIWLQKKDTDQVASGKAFGPRVFHSSESAERVIEPGIVDKGGPDWSQTIPSFIGRRNENGIWMREDGTPAHGTVVVLLGNHANQDTILGDPDHDDLVSKTGNLKLWEDFKYLDALFWSLPEGVSIRIRTPHCSEKDRWLTDMQTVTIPDTASRGRIFKPYSMARKDMVEAFGEVKLTDSLPATVYWFKRPKTVITERHYLGQSQIEGYFGVLYGQEFYERHDTTVHRSDGGFANRVAQSKFRRFGIASQDVMKQVILVIEPQAQNKINTLGAFPNDTRSGLSWCDGRTSVQELPFDEWGEEFISKMPIEIKKAIEEANLISDSVDQIQFEQDLLQEFHKEYGDYLKAETLVENPSGPIEGEVVVKPAKKGGIRPPVPAVPPVTTPSTPLGSERATKNGKGELKPVGYVLPTIKWLAPEQFKNQVGYSTLFVDYDYVNRLIYLNLGHAIYQLCVTRHTRSSMADHQTIIKFVQGAIARSIVSKILHAEARLKDYARDQTLAEAKAALFTPEALTVAAGGLFDVDKIVASMLSSYGTRRSVKETTKKSLSQTLVDA